LSPAPARNGRRRDPRSSRTLVAAATGASEITSRPPRGMLRQSRETKRAARSSACCGPGHPRGRCGNARERLRTGRLYSQNTTFIIVGRPAGYNLPARRRRGLRADRKRRLERLSRPPLRVATSAVAR
jgi:hypothetical protein